MRFHCQFAARLPENQRARFCEQFTQIGLQLEPVPPASGLYVQADESGLALAKVGQKGRVCVDFVDGAARHRRLFGGGELLSRAVQANTRPTVWDATGGLGRDAFVLATLGLTVHVFERHPVVFALLHDGWTRALANDAVSPIAQRLQPHFGSIVDLAAPSWSQALPPPDVVYLDPMYPQRQKTAAVKKEMAYFHELVGVGAASAENQAEESTLLTAAQRLARRRVVVKRPQKGAFLANQAPAFQYQGKTTRFDVYLPAVLDNHGA